MTEITTGPMHFATAAHSRINHQRKYTSKPYAVHLKAVAEVVASVTDDPPLIAAAWLHDIVEDTPVTFEDLKREFGSEIAAIVKELTDVSRPTDGNRAARKDLDRNHLLNASPRAKTVKLADLIDNASDICRHDPAFGKIYLRKARALLQVLHEGQQSLYAKADRDLHHFAAKLGIELWPLSINEESGEKASDALAISGVSGQHGIRLFTEAFTARDILEPLASFDAHNLDDLFQGQATRPEDIVFGVRHQGCVTGHILSSDWVDGRLKNPRSIDSSQVVNIDAALDVIIHILTNYQHCFVSLNGAVIGVISRGDMEKPVVRMWLFGILILIESLAVNHARSLWPEESWRSFVSPGRLEKAEQLRVERQRRGISAELLDCLQFSDKLQVVTNDPQFLESSGLKSMSVAKSAFKEFESLRNNLANGQIITARDWAPIARLAPEDS